MIITIIIGRNGGGRDRGRKKVNPEYIIVIGFLNKVMDFY